MEYHNMLLSVNGPIATVTINRPEKRNSMDSETIGEISHVIDILERMKDVLVVILTGAGENTFVAGADIKKIQERTFLDALEPGLQGLCDRIEHFDKPVIAAINGFALGGGCELALACDIRIASENAKLGFPELGFGLIPGAGGTQRLSKLIGKGKAKELIFTGDIITAQEAERVGLVNKVVLIEQLMDTAIEMASKIAHKAPIALFLSKKAINMGEETSQHAGMLIEKLSQAVIESTEDKREGTKAFVEKRNPIFKGL